MKNAKWAVLCFFVLTAGCATGTVLSENYTDGTASDSHQVDTSTDTEPFNPNDSESGSDTGNDTNTESVCDGTITTCINGDSCCPTGCTPADDNDCRPPFGYIPSNFNPDLLAIEDAPPLVALDCEALFDSSGKTTFIEWCGQTQPPVWVDSESSSKKVILTFNNLNISSTGSLTVVGDRPVILAVFGVGIIDGVVDASADGATPGPGGNHSCMGSQGGSGTGSTTFWEGASGGGGGGFGTAGGKGGDGNTDNLNLVGIQVGGVGGEIFGTYSLIPLRGGCPGGQAGDCASPGGAGGGAIQISAGQSLTVNGAIRTNGGDGAPGCGTDEEQGGTGGGSGGGILVEAPILQLTETSLQANGGNGGLNGTFCGAFFPNCDLTAGGAGADNAGSPGSPGEDVEGGGPGGGGGFGRIVTILRR